MNVYHFHPETRALEGFSKADADPKNPTRFLIPANCTTVTPPPSEEGNVRVFVDGAWGYVPIADIDAEATTEPHPLDLEAYAAERRWVAETSGCRFNKWQVKTDAESQAKVAAERLAIEAGVREDADAWKFSDGQFRVLTNEEFCQLSVEIRNHVRNSFAREAAVQVAISDGTVTTKQQVNDAFIDVSAPWVQ